MNTGRRSFCFLAATVCVAPAMLLVVDRAGGQSPEAPQRQRLSIEAFNALKPRWGHLADASAPLRVEGRYQGFSPGLLRMRNCEVPFQPRDGDEFPRLAGDSRALEIEGRLARENGRVVFVVDRLREAPSDMQRLRAMKTGIGRAKPDEWYALADWAAVRGAFYRDRELLAEAQSARLTGIALERERMPPGDAAARFALAERAARLELPEALRLELLHEGHRLRWDVVQKEASPDFERFAEAVARDLPGCREPLDPPQPELARRYRASPLLAYQEADDDLRKLLHRVFYSEVLLAALRRGLRADRSNGDEVAAKIEAQVPEEGALAERLRDAALDHRFSRLDTFTRREALALAEDFRGRDRPGRARETLETWLAERTRRLRRDGFVGLREAAEEYLSLLDDEETAARLLIEAHELNPESRENAERLRRLGYEWKNGRWMTRAEAAALPPDPFAQAIRDGRVEAGMSPAQVRAALGLPHSRARIATHGQINEVWTFGEPGTARLAVHFERRRSSADARVVRISRLPAR